MLLCWKQNLEALFEAAFQILFYVQIQNVAPSKGENVFNTKIKVIFSVSKLLLWILKSPCLVEILLAGNLLWCLAKSVCLDF